MKYAVKRWKSIAGTTKKYMDIVSFSNLKDALNFQKINGGILGKTTKPDKKGIAKFTLL